MSTPATEATRRLLTVAEVADRLRCSRQTIWRRVHDGSLPGIRLGGPGSSIRIREDELSDWLYAEPEETFEDPARAPRASSAEVVDPGLPAGLGDAA